MKKSLGQVLDRPLRTLRDFSNTPMARVQSALHIGVNEFVYPPECAQRFYLGQHVIGSMVARYGLSGQLPPQDEAILIRLEQDAASTAALVFKYLLMICHRESRHLRLTDESENALIELQKHTASTLLEYTEGLHEFPSDKAQEYLLQCGIPDPEGQSTANLGAYTSHLRAVFKYGVFSNSFGGRAWLNIASVLDNFVHGAITAEMLVDTAWTLSHNTCNIFNKEVYFSEPTDDAMLRVLDVQRSGQIPSMILIEESTSSGVYKLLQEVQKALPWFEVPTSIDWFRVEKLGAVCSYNYEKAHPNGANLWSLYPDEYVQMIPGVYLHISKHFRERK